MKETGLSKQSTGYIWLGIGLGALVGAAAACLTTPKKGKEVRELLIEKAYLPLRMKFHEMVGKLNVKVKPGLSDEAPSVNSLHREGKVLSPANRLYQSTNNV